MTLKAGETAVLRVAREAPPHGYVLTDGVREVLLHHRETDKRLNIGDHVRVFLYVDKKDRLVGTAKLPLIRLGEIAPLTVAEVNLRLGCFLDMGLSRQLLLPNSELPESSSLRPQKGDRVYVLLTRDKQGRLLAQLAGEEQLSPLADRAGREWKNAWVKATVYNPLRIGAFAVCSRENREEEVIGFIHHTEQTRPLRLGETVRARVAHVRPDGRVNLSMRPPKEESREEDAERLWAFLRSRPGGAMPYSDDTPADIIRQKFGMSKSSFKRALGKLMKEQLVCQEDGWTYILDNGKRQG